MFLPIYVTLWDAQNRSYNCNLYAKGFLIDDIQTYKYDNGPELFVYYIRNFHLLPILTKIHCIHFISMDLANMSSLQMCPVLDAVSPSE